MFFMDDSDSDDSGDFEAPYVSQDGQDPASLDIPQLRALILRCLKQRSYRSGMASVCQMAGRYSKVAADKGDAASQFIHGLLLLNAVYVAASYPFGFSHDDTDDFCYGDHLPIDDVDLLHEIMRWAKFLEGKDWNSQPHWKMLHKNFEEAARHLKESADAGIIPAQFYYKICLKEGVGVEKNRQMSARYGAMHIRAAPMYEVDVCPSIQWYEVFTSPQIQSLPIKPALWKQEVVDMTSPLMIAMATPAFMKMWLGICHMRLFMGTWPDWDSKEFQENYRDGGVDIDTILPWLKSLS